MLPSLGFLERLRRKILSLFEPAAQQCKRTVDHLDRAVLFVKLFAQFAIYFSLYIDRCDVSMF